MSNSNMRFIPELKTFLREHGEIYTVRKYNMSSARIEIDGLEGTYQRDHIRQIYSPEELIPHVPLSGFSTLEDWWRKILYFIPDAKIPKYLYHVYKVEEKP